MTTDHETSTLAYSGSGDVTGGLVPTADIVMPPTPAPSSTSGCEVEDFLQASRTEPQVALIQTRDLHLRGEGGQPENAGYDAVVVFNEGSARP